MELFLRLLAAAVPLVLAWAVLELRGLRLTLERETRRRQEAEGRERLQVRRDGERLAQRVQKLEAELEQTREAAAGRMESGADPAGGEADKELSRAAMLEGFDNLMRYTERTARGWAE